MIRRISSYPAVCSRSLSNGVVPVSSSYSSTPEGVHVGSGVHVQPAQLGLLRAHVQRRADHLRRSRVYTVLSVSCWPIALATPKSITLGTGLPSCTVDQDVGRLQVAVDDALLVGVLDRLADLDEQSEPLADGEPVLGRSTR